MPFLALKEWAAANSDYNADKPPYWHTKAVPDGFTMLSGVLWSVSYVLMAQRAFSDSSYSMPIFCLCLNITWEAVYGFVYGPGTVNQIVFAQWMIVDLVLFYAIVKSGKRQWKHSPLVQQNLVWIILGGCIFCLLLHLAIAATFVPHVGRRIVFFTAWPMQLLINIGSIAQLLSRGHTAGHSWGIWWTRMLGTLAAGCCFYWRIIFWPKRFGYAWTPYGAFLLLGSHFFDFLYPFVFISVQRYEKVSGIDQSNSVIKVDGKRRN